jgi:hypothetical protein
MAVTAFVAALYAGIPVSGWAGTVVHTLELVLASLTTGLTVTRLAVHYAAEAAVRRAYASRRRIRTITLLLKAPVLGVAVFLAAVVLWIAFTNS